MDLAQRVRWSMSKQSRKVIGEKISNLKFRLRLSLYHQSREEYEVRPNAKVTTRLYHYGERIRFAAKLRPPSTSGFCG
jgi:hypothetical protein